jgi:hypothetical protein
MKNTRALLMVVLAVTSICVCSGCATSGDDSRTVVIDSSGLEKQQQSPTKDMNDFQKTGYYLGLFSLDFIYAWASSNPSFSP